MPSKNSWRVCPAFVRSMSFHAPPVLTWTLWVDATNTLPVLSTAMPCSRSSPAPIAAFSSTVHFLPSHMPTPLNVAAQILPSAVTANSSIDEPSSLNPPFATFLNLSPSSLSTSSKPTT